MNIQKFGILLLMSLLAISSVVMAQGNDDVRVLVPATSFMDRLAFNIKGCDIVHDLNDATALSCPADVAAGLKNAREDRIFHIVELESDQQIEADRVWDELGFNGTGVSVAVLDTGIDIDHPELAGSYLGGHDYVDDDDVPDDWYGHGTHVAGIITADGADPAAKGVAPGAGIYMYKVCGTYGCYESDIMDAMEDAVTKKTEDPTLKVMSLSIGGGSFSGNDCDSDPLAAKVNWVVSQGITVIVASGSDAVYVNSPACASGAIAVGSVDKDYRVAFFSNHGPALDILAPGANIYSSVIDGYGTASGTSFSAPQVAGTVALMLEANSSLETDDIKTALYDTADPVNSSSVCYEVIGWVPGWNGTAWVPVPVHSVAECSSNHTGAGVVNAYGAVSAIAEPVCGNNILETGEECDDGNNVNGDGCSSQCVDEFTYVYGLVYDEGTGFGIDYAHVTVECLNNSEVREKDADENGTYFVWVDCPVDSGVIVTASKNDVEIGSNSGTVEIYAGVPTIPGANVPVGVAPVDVAIPEFPITAIPMLLSALSFGLVRRRLI